MQAAQTDFEQARIVYETEKAKEGMVENATLVKKYVLTILNDKIVIYLRAMEQAIPETFGVFAGTVAEIIATTNEQVKKRQQKPDVDKPEEKPD